VKAKIRRISRISPGLPAGTLARRQGLQALAHGAPLFPELPPGFGRRLQHLENPIGRLGIGGAQFGGLP